MDCRMDSTTTRIEDLVLARADTSPDAVALRRHGDTISFSALRARARGLAAMLETEGATKAPVGVLTHTSIDTVVAMLGCLIAGVPYVPIDPGLPAARRDVILSDAGVELVVHDEEVDLRGLIDRDVTLLASTSASPSTACVVAEERSPIASILYTSGSTGVPKGVVVLHENVVPFMRWAERVIALDHDDVVLCQSPLHFDMHIVDLFVALAAGASVVLVDRATTLFPRAVFEALAANRVTFVLGVPSSLIGLLRVPALGAAGLPALRTIAYGGEEFPVAQLRALAALVPHARIINMYGPVETNAVTALVVTREHLELARVPIGRPAESTSIILIDDDGAIIDQPEVEGEIAVHGPSVSPGYLNDPELTRASRAVVDHGGTRTEYYRTGDYGHRDVEGLLHFRGRRDQRVKTRGYRVELGDLEATLERHGAVELAVVVPVPHEEHTNVLHAFVTPSAEELITGDELLRWLRSAVPSFMLPRRLDVRPSMPRTASGKIDRQALLSEAANQGS